MKRFALTLVAALAGLLSTFSSAAEQCLVLGDSLSKEYEVEFPILFPNNPDSWDSRNWIEILHQHRSAWFDNGTVSPWPDVRIVGHRHNWAFPGATTQELRDTLSSGAWYHSVWQAELKKQLSTTVERVVIFAGGNDIEDIYGKLYNAQSATNQLSAIRSNLQWIMDYVRQIKPSLKIVLVAVPHVGACPHVQQGYPTHATKTARVTAALDLLNSQLAASAKTRGIAFADVYAFTKAAISQRVYIGSTEIVRQADADSRPQYLFSGDGFHPATAGQARMAQIILNAFRIRWPTPAIPALTETDILQATGLR